MLRKLLPLMKFRFTHMYGQHLCATLGLMLLTLTLFSLASAHTEHSPGARYRCKWAKRASSNMAVKVAMRAGRGRGGSAGRKGRDRGAGKMAKAAHGKGSIKLKGNDSSVVKACVSL